MQSKTQLMYILESNPHRFYSFRWLKNQMRIRIACGLDSRSWAGFWKNDRAAVRAVRTIQYNNLLFYLLFTILYNIYNLLFIRLAVITHNWISLSCRQGTVEGKCGLEPRTNFFSFKKSAKILRIRFENIRYIYLIWGSKADMVSGFIQMLICKTHKSWENQPQQQRRLSRQILLPRPRRLWPRDPRAMQLKLQQMGKGAGESPAP